jgi:hypothetical protein
MNTVPSAPIAPPIQTPVNPKKSKLPLIIVGVVLILAVVLAAAFFIFKDRIFGDRMLVGFVDSNQEADIYLVKSEQDERDGIRIAKDIPLGNSIAFTRGSELIKSVYNSGFVPGTNLLYLSYENEDGETVIEDMRFNEEETSPVFQGETYNSTLLVDLSAGLASITESTSSSDRCYVGNIGDELERVAKGDTCSVYAGGRQVVYEKSDSDSYTLSVVDNSGKNDAELINAETPIDSFDISEDGSTLVYEQDTGGLKTLSIIDIGTQKEEVLTSDVFNILAYNFIPGQNKLYYIVETLDGTLELHLSSTDSSIASGYFLNAIPTEDGDTLIYLVGDSDSEVAAYSYSIGSGKSTKILDGHQLAVFSAKSLDKIVLVDVDEEETTLYAADLNGKNATELYNEDDASINSVFTVDSKKGFFFIAETEDGDSLFYSSDGISKPLLMVEDYYSIGPLLAMQNGTLLVATLEEEYDDDPVLAAIPVADKPKIVELDDDFAFIFSAFPAKNGKKIYYTTVNDVADLDLSVRAVTLDGKEHAEELYQDAVILDVSWEDPGQMRFSYDISALEGTSYCPGAPRLEIGNSSEHTLGEDEPLCVSFLGKEGELIGFDLLPAGSDNLSAGMDVYDREGNYLADSAGVLYGDSYSQFVFEVPADGLYFLKVFNQGSRSGQIAISTAYRVSATESAIPLNLGASTNGIVNGSTRFYLKDQMLDVYGNVYRISAQADQRLKVSVNPSFLNTDYNFYLVLYDADFNDIDFTAIQRSSVASITYQVPESGTYYAAVAAFSGDEIPTSKILEYSLKTEEVLDSFSSALPISFNTRVNNSITSATPLIGVDELSSQYGVMYKFTGRVGDRISIETFADSIGKPLDTTLYLLDSSGSIVAYDDDDGQEYDSFLTYTLQSTNPYYIVVVSYNDRLRSATENYFEIILSR